MKSKIILTSLFILVCSISVFAQRKEISSNDYTPSDAYISLGTGINYNTGIFGVQFEKKIGEKISGYIGAGFGTWGKKITIGGRYYYGAASTSAVSFSYSYVTGSSGVKSQLDVIDSTVTGFKTKKDVNFDANPVSTINLSWLKYWRLGKKSRFNLEIGYSVLLNSNYESNYNLKDPVKLTDVSKSAIQIIQPGGLIIGVGFSFGL